MSDINSAINEVLAAHIKNIPVDQKLAFCANWFNTNFELCREVIRSRGEGMYFNAHLRVLDILSNLATCFVDSNVHYDDYNKVCSLLR